MDAAREPQTISGGIHDRELLFELAEPILGDKGATEVFCNLTVVNKFV